ncbi:MAG: hypothetical protein HQK55_05555 [Deltaproteobacteria bacterium]|nr:hypothetical protein [Deltaproteobacteria bacterium]
MFFVCLDSNKTQDYVFSSARLRGIRNASRLLEDADRSAEQLITLHHGRCIRALGAVIIAEFDSDDDASKFVSEAMGTYRRHGISIEAAKIEINKPTGLNFYKDVITKLLRDLRKKKDSPKSIQPNPPSTILAANCELSGLGSANQLVKRGPEVWRASSIEYKKWTLREEDEQAITILQNVSSKWGVDSGELTFGFPKTEEGIVGWNTEDLEDTKAKPGSSEARLLGMIFADVNGLGDLLPEIAADKNIYKSFAHDLRQCLFDSVAQGVAEVFRQAMQVRTKTASHNLALPFRLLYLGGDDLCFLVLGAYALPLIHEIISNFEQRTEQLIECVQNELPQATLPSHLTLSAGVVLAPYKYPILLFRQLGLELEAHAKLCGRAWAKLHSRLTGTEIYPPSLVDYYLVKNNAAGGLDQVRTVLKKNDVDLFGGPYWAGLTSPDNNKRFEGLPKLLSVAESLADFSAGRKLKLLPAILSGDNAQLLYQDWWDHLDKGQQVITWQTVLNTLNLPNGRDLLPIGPNNMTTILDALDMIPLEELRQRWEKQL